MGRYCGIDSWERRKIRKSIKEDRLNPNLWNVGTVYKRRFLFFSWYD